MKCYQKILETIDSTIKKNCLLCNEDRVLVALSGGSDSVLLLHFLKILSQKYNYKISAAHLNHSLRKEADSEESFVVSLCDSLGIPIFTKKADINELSQNKGISTEAAGREERYSFFDELKDKYGFTKIATAHHLDDNAETILMHFMRGAGIKGLGGIDYIRDNLIIRPLLDIKKSDILKCCQEQNWSYVTDLSNFDDIYTRNKLRLKLIPEIKKINPNFSSVITDNSKLFKEDEEFLNSYTHKIFENQYENGLKKSVIDEQPKAISRRLIQMLYKKNTASTQNLSQKYIDMILNLSTSGSIISLPSGYIARLQYGVVNILPLEDKSKEFQYEIRVGEQTYIPEACEYWTLKAADKFSKNTFYIENNTKLIIRSRKKGDLFYPIGMSGKKTISNFFTDKKIPREKRDIIPILTANDEIVSIGGKYNDRRFYKNHDKDKNLYYIEITKNKE